MSGLAGEGFKLTTSAGVSYYFDVATTRTASTLEKWVKTSNGELPSQYWLHRKRFYLMASQIEDRFGNWVRISYNTSGHPIRVWSNDGRSIELAYTSGQLTSATSHGRSWQYQYTESGDSLAAVINPDGSRWQYQYTGDLRPYVHSSDSLPPLPYCQDFPSILDVAYTLQATHPAGAAGTFQFVNRRHTRSGVHAGECHQIGDPADPTYVPLIPYYFDVMSLASKSISGPGQPTAMTWSYAYPGPVNTWWGTWGTPFSYPCTTCDSHKFVEVTQPDGSLQRHKFGILYWVNDGRSLGVETLGPSQVVLRSEATDYLSDALASGQVFQGDYGSILDMADPSTARVRPVVKRVTTQQSKNFVWEVATGCNGTYCFDAYARPTKVVKSSSP